MTTAISMRAMVRAPRMPSTQGIVAMEPSESHTAHRSMTAVMTLDTQIGG